KFGPSGALQRPLALPAFDEAIGVANLKLHRRLFVPTILLSVQEGVEETQMQITGLNSVKKGPLLDALGPKPFLLGGGADKTLEIPSRVQPLSTPIGCREKRRLHLRPDRRARLVVIIIERMGDYFSAELTAIFRQLVVGQEFRTADQLAMHTTALTALARAVLHRLDLHVVPVFPKRAENSAVVGHVAIPVGGAFPDAHRRKMRRLQAGNVPLINAVIGNAVQSDFTVGPWLCTGPFDAVVKVLGLTRGKMIDVAG